MMTSPVRALLAALVLVLSTVVGVPAASAAPTCHGHSCDGRDPISTGCSRDAVTLRSRTWSDHAAGGTFGQHTVWLRYSARCNASWARVTTSAGGTAHVTRVGAWLRGHRAATLGQRHSAGTVHSLMLSGKHRVAAGRSTFNEGAVSHRTYVHW